MAACMREGNKRSRVGELEGKVFMYCIVVCRHITFVAVAGRCRQGR